MLNTRFEAYKIEREIKRSGVRCNVSRYTQNEFKEKSGELVAVTSFDCLFHVEKSYVEVVDTDGTKYRNVGTPKVLCLCEDVLEVFEIGDVVVLSNNNDKKYTLNEVNDVMELGILYDISLATVDVGDGNG